MMGNYHVRCGAGEKPEAIAPEAYLSLFGKILDFKKLISTVRSRGINCQVIVQSVAQLSDRYEKKEWEELVGNCDIQLFLGCNDNMTAEYISGKCGMVTIRQTNNQMPMTPLFSPVLNSTRPYTQTQGSTQRALMLPDEVLRLPNDQCIVLLRGQKPLLLHKIIPDELPMFRELVPVKITDYVPEWRRAEEQQKVNLDKPKKQEENNADPALPQEGNGKKGKKPAGSTRYSFPTAPQEEHESKREAAHGMPVERDGPEEPAEFDDDMPLLLDEISPEEILGTMGQKHEEGKQ